MKVRKKFAAMLLAVCMVLTLLPAGALADTSSAPQTSAPITVGSVSPQPNIPSNAPSKGTITVKKVGSASTFKIYQLYTAAVASGTSNTYAYAKISAKELSSLPDVSVLANDTADQLSALAATLHSAISSGSYAPSDTITA
jgi:hypothetical protein